MTAWTIHVDAPAGQREQCPAQASIPLPRGSAALPPFSVRQPSGNVVPAQARTLIPWPDGSPRWVQLDFQSDAAGIHTVQDAPSSGAPSLPVAVQRDGDRIAVTVGRLQAVFQPAGASPIAALSWNGRALTDGSSPWKFVVIRDDGRAFPLAAGTARNLVTEAEGAHRLQFAWEAEHRDADGQRLLDARFRVEFLAGVEGFSLAYQFFHKLPGTNFIALQSIDADLGFRVLAAGAAARAVAVQTAYTELWLRRFVRTRNPVTLLLDRTQRTAYVADAATVEDDAHYPYFLMRDARRPMGSAVALEDDRVAVLCAMRDFECQRPKTLAVRPGRIQFGIWPERAGGLTLPQGRSCRQIFDFRFMDPDEDAVNNRLWNPKAMAVAPARGWLDRSACAHAGASWDPPRLLAPDAPGATLFSNLLHSATGRWTTVAEMFHYGDVPDPGYMRTYADGGRVPPEAGALPEYTLAAGHSPHPFLHSVDRLPRVWTNNEYDVIYALALETLRTRNAAALEKLRAAARHQIEVDFVHYSDHWMHHRSTPQHSIDHTTCMATIPSHQWTQGLYYYYVITGDEDVPEVVRAIGDFDIAFMQRPEFAESLQFDRELGWTVVALTFAFELTGDSRYAMAARTVIDRLAGVANRSDFENYEKLHPTSRGMNIQGLGSNFNHNTIPLGLKVYHQATQEEWARDLLIEWVAYGMTNHNNRATGVKLSELFPETFCYVAELTGDTRYIEESLWQLVLFFRGFNSLGWLDEGATLSTKAYARIYRGLAHYLGALARAGILPRVEKWLIGEGRI